MDDFVIGYNRSVINKQEVIHGYQLLNRHQYIINYLIIMVYLAVISVFAILYSVIPIDLKIIVISVVISSFIVVLSKRVQTKVSIHNSIDSKFKLDDDMTLYFTFYHKIAYVDVSVAGTKKTYTIPYHLISKICYDYDIVMLKNIEEEHTFWFNPVFLKGITLQNLIEFVHVENPDVKVVRVIIE